MYTGPIFLFLIVLTVVSIYKKLDAYFDRKDAKKHKTRKLQKRKRNR